MRTPDSSRLYLQCAPDEDIADWPDDRIWEELQTRTAAATGLQLPEGRSCRRASPPMRSFVVEPMQYGRLFLAGDAAHIVPPTGAKGMNLAIADVRVLARALAAFYKSGRADLLESYSRDLPAPRLEGAALLLVDDASAASLRQRQRLRPAPPAGGARLRHQLARRRLTLAENYVGLPMEWE